MLAQALLHLQELWHTPVFSSGASPDKGHSQEEQFLDHIADTDDSRM
jgi:hypothetical protein